MKKTIALLFLCILTGAAIAASNGAVGNTIVTWFEKMLQVDPDKALALFGSLTTLLCVGIRFVLKIVPTKMQGLVGFVLWHIAAFFFGDGVKLENNTDSNYVKEQLIKKYPLLQIDIKPDGTIR